MSEEKCGARGNCINEATELHTCPFQSDVHDDDEFLCDCCADCAYECAMDI